MPIEGNVNSPPYIEGRVSGNISSFHSLSGEVTLSKGGGAIELFWAAYGTTTYGEIVTEYQSGKQILVRYLDYICNLVRFEDEQFVFSCILPGESDSQSVVSLICDESGWTASTVHNIPSGGNTGDILVKNSNGNYDASWVAPANAVEQDNTLPITSAAVYTEVGNINALLATI